MFKSKENVLCTALLALNIIVVATMVWSCFNVSVWVDEVFDLNMIKHNFSYFLMKNRDAAPPFHFTVLKIFVDTARVLMPGVNPVYIAKISSLVPYLIIITVSYTYVRRHFGMLAAALSGLICVTMPKLYPFATELRMYSWAIMIAYLWFIAFHHYIICEDTKSAVLITLFGTLGVFTHYYVVFGVIYAYAFYFFYSLYKKKYKCAISIACVSAASAVLYLPWVIIAYKSVVKMASNFWIPKSSGKKAAKDFFYPIKPDVTKLNIDTIGAIVICIIIIFLIWRLVKSEKNGNLLFSFIGLTMPFAVAIIGTLIGKYLFSVFQPRYVLVVMACFWATVAIIIDKYDIKPIVKYGIIAFLVCISVLNVAKHVKDEVSYAKNIDIFCEFLSTYDGLVAIDDGRVYNCLSYYADNETISMSGKDDHYDEAVALIKEGKCEYLLHSNMENVDSTYLDKLENDGISIILVETCGIEYVGLEIYKFSVAE